MIQKEKYKGLTSTQVEENRKLYGANILTPPKREPLWKLFLEKFSDPIIRILLVAAFISLGISIRHGEFIETIGIFCAILLATGIAFWFETDANRKFDILNQVNDDTPVKVLRDGMFMEIPKKDIVKDDIIILETGDEIPADAEILESVSLSVNESTLTGEPSIEKSADPKEFDKDSTYPTNHLFRGTTIIEGHCICKVFAVGDSTEFGKVAEKSTEKGGEETPLNKQLEGLARVIGIVGFTLAIFTFSAMFVKDIFIGKTSYSGSQLYLLFTLISGLIISSSKIWMPIIFDGLAVVGLKKGLPKSFLTKSSTYWITIGILFILILSFFGYLFGINPLSTDTWIEWSTVEIILQYFMVAVTLIVVAVPEGLPMSVTLSLALSMRRMLQTNNLVRKMHA
ncbi:MAG: cation-transporting P-type ATPase, partial [Bacteroidales bacterium]